jgi:hypothetical protein
MAPITDETKALLQEAKAAGCMFYKMPWDLEGESVDKLILPMVLRINQSGWVWTAESCAGHPDATEWGSWASNTDPMLRLVTRCADWGRLLHHLADAYLSASAAVEESHRTPESLGIFEVGGIRLHPSTRVKPHWREVLVYLGAKTAYQRNQGLDVFRRFAEAVTRSAAD